MFFTVFILLGLCDVFILRQLSFDMAGTCGHLLIIWRVERKRKDDSIENEIIEKHD